MIARHNIQIFTQAERILLRTNDYIYLLPHPLLRDYISNYTITFPNREIISENYTVIPHGSATLVFSYNRNGLSGNLFGPATRPCTVGGHANRSEMLMIVEFQPAGFFVFTGMNQKELSDLTLPLELINITLNKLMKEVIERTNTLEELVSALDSLLLACQHKEYPEELRLASHLIMEKFGTLSMKELSGSVYYSERHLNRIFGQYLGMNLKTFSRMVRINKFIRLLQEPERSITEISAAAGFYDLPHLIHDFKSVCKITPQGYRDNMSDFYSEIAKF